MDKTIDYDRNNLVDGFEDEDLERYLKAEEEFMPAEGYAQSNEVILRATAVRTILNSRLDNADVFEQYLALIYFDRFISKNPLPNVIDCVRDEVVLVANCCLMIAYKMRPDTFDVHRFLVKTKMINNGRHVRIVELVILNSLKWDLELTAISFVNMVIPRITGAENIKRRVVNEIIIQAIGDKTVTKYRPSVIAAAAIMTACSLTLREMQPICYKWIVDTKFVNEVDLEACFVKFCQMCMDKKIIRKKDREAPQSPRVRAASRSPAKDPKLRISDTDAERIVERIHGKEPKLGSSDADTDRKFERRPGKEPMSMSKTKKVGLPVCFGKFRPLCIDKKIIMETDREAPQSPRARAASRSPVKEPKLRISDTDGERKFERRHGKEPKLSSSDADADTDRKFERRPGKEPMSMSKTKNKPVAVPENKIDDSESDDEIIFKLKWILWITNPEEIQNDFPHFRNHNPQYRKAAHRKKIFRGYRGFLFSFD